MAGRFLFIISAKVSEYFSGCKVFKIDHEPNYIFEVPLSRWCLSIGRLLQRKYGTYLPHLGEFHSNGIWYTVSGIKVYNGRDYWTYINAMSHTEESPWHSSSHDSHDWWKRQQRKNKSIDPLAGPPICDGSSFINPIVPSWCIIFIDDIYLMGAVMIESLLYI